MLNTCVGVGSFVQYLTIIMFQVGSLCLLYDNISKANPSEMIKAFKKYSCTALMGSPAFVEKVAVYALKNNTILPLKYTGVGGAPVYRRTLRTISSVTPDRKTLVIYGSTEAEPISMIFAEEKMELESFQPDGLCVGKPVFKGSVKVVHIHKGLTVCLSACSLIIFLSTQFLLTQLTYLRR